MEKTLRLALNRYRPIPTTLRAHPTVDQPASEIRVGLASLYHHYYLDSYGSAPPDPDPSQFEHVRFLLPVSEFRFQGSGLGISPAVKAHRSNELGQAFCRWFLHEHLGITYFAHVQTLLGRQLMRPFAGFSLERVAPGDTPDYLCATAAGNAYLAEAKGSYDAIGFQNRAFSKWRAQFDRVGFQNATGVRGSLKGHLVATRFATEADAARVKTTLFAEDPASPGDTPLDVEASFAVSDAVRAAHYSRIAEKLRQPILAAALNLGVPMPDELRVQAIAWAVVVGPLQGMRFVGGYFVPSGMQPTWGTTNGVPRIPRPDPLNLSSPGLTFFGLEETVFRQVVQAARSRRTSTREISPFNDIAFFYSAFSVLRDGTALGPLEFFAPVAEIEL